MSFNRWVSLTLFLSFICFEGMTGSMACAFEAAVDSRNPKDVEVLRRSTHGVWYDTSKGDIKPASAKQANADVADRHSSILVEKVKNPTGGSGFRAAIADLFSWLFGFWQIILLVCLLMIVAVIVFFVLKIGTTFSRAESYGSVAAERKKAAISDLPFELERTMLGLREQAELYRSQGDYSKAIIYLFSHVLIEMDSARCIRLERGKTNRSYLRELRGRDKLRGFANQLIHAFEYTFFGKHPISQEVCEKIWQQLPAFGNYIQQVESTETEQDVRPMIVGAS
jgi:hypothetical protein